MLYIAASGLPREAQYYHSRFGNRARIPTMSTRARFVGGTTSSGALTLVSDVQSEQVRPTNVHSFAPMRRRLRTDC